MKLRTLFALLLLAGFAALAGAATPAYIYPTGPSLMTFPIWIGTPPASTSVDSLLYLAGTPTGVEYSFYSSSTLPSYFAGNLEAKVVLPKILTVATLPTCNAALFGAIASVTDGNGATDCTTGASTTDVACECNGSAWAARYTGAADTSAYVLKTAAAQQSVTASGAGNDVTLTAADDVILAATDDTTVAGDQFAVNTTTAVIDAGGGADEVTVAAGSVTLTGSLILPIASAPPAACSSGTKGTIYYDSDINKLCVCNATDYVLVDDATTTTGCAQPNLE